MGSRYEQLITPETRQAQAVDLKDARDWGQTWDSLAAQRLQAAQQGKWSPWLGVKQWAAEIPLNANMRGYDANADDAIKARDAAFQAEMERLKSAAAAGQPAKKIEKVWNRVK